MNRELSKRTLVIKQPYFFPWIGFWQELYASDQYVVFDDVNYINRGWINRNRILVDGKPKYFNLPVNGKSQNKLINQIKVDNEEAAIHRNRCILHDAYRKAPHYDDVIPVIEKILYCRKETVSEYLTVLIKEICEYMGIETDIVISSELINDKSLRAQEKILDICRRLQAERYVDSMGATELYNRKSFAESGIELLFLKTDNIAYKQYDNEFQKNLSIIDVMMFNSISEIRAMLGKFELV